MKILVAKLFIALLALTSLPITSEASTTTTNVAPTLVCEPCGTYTVNGHDTNIHTIYIPAGHTHINISGDGDTDLDLTVTDYYGNPMVRSASDTDDEAVCLKLYQGGWFRVRVKNLGHAYNRYQLWLS